MRNDLRQITHFICVLTITLFCSTILNVCLVQAQDAGQAPTPSTQVKPQPTKDSPEWMEARLTKIHQKLHITNEQEAIWNEYAKGMREAAQSMQPLYTRYYKEQSTMNAVENMHLYMEMSEANAKAQKTLIPLFEKLYNTLSDKQKTIADEFFSDQPTPARQKK